MMDESEENKGTWRAQPRPAHLLGTRKGSGHFLQNSHRNSFKSGEETENEVSTEPVVDSPVLQHVKSGEPRRHSGMAPPKPLLIKSMLNPQNEVLNEMKSKALLDTTSSTSPSNGTANQWSAPANPFGKRDKDKEEFYSKPEDDNARGTWSGAKPKAGSWISAKTAHTATSPAVPVALPAVEDKPEARKISEEDAERSRQANFNKQIAQTLASEVLKKKTAPQTAPRVVSAGSVTPINSKLSVPSSITADNDADIEKELELEEKQFERTMQSQGGISVRAVPSVDEDPSRVIIAQKSVPSSVPQKQKEEDYHKIIHKGEPEDDKIVEEPAQYGILSDLREDKEGLVQSGVVVEEERPQILSIEYEELNEPGQYVSNIEEVQIAEESFVAQAAYEIEGESEEDKEEAHQIVEEVELKLAVATIEVLEEIEEGAADGEADDIADATDTLACQDVKRMGRDRKSTNTRSFFNVFQTPVLPDDVTSVPPPVAIQKVHPMRAAVGRNFSCPPDIQHEAPISIASFLENIGMGKHLGCFADMSLPTFLSLVRDELYLLSLPTKDIGVIANELDRFAKEQQKKKDIWLQMKKQEALKAANVIPRDQQPPSGLTNTVVTSPLSGGKTNSPKRTTEKQSQYLFDEGDDWLKVRQRKLSTPPKVAAPNPRPALVVDNPRPTGINYAAASPLARQPQSKNRTSSGQPMYGAKSTDFVKAFAAGPVISETSLLQIQHTDSNN